MRWTTLIATVIPIAGCTTPARETPRAAELPLPTPTPTVSTPPPSSPVAPAPVALPWPTETTMMVSDLGTNDIHQTRDHVVWKTVEGKEGAATVRKSVVSLDKKTLAKKIIYTEVLPVARVRELSLFEVWSSPDHVFVDTAKATVRVAPDGSGKPILLPKAPEAGGAQCADADALYQLYRDKLTVVAIGQGGAPKKTTHAMTIGASPFIQRCIVEGAWIYFVVQSDIQAAARGGSIETLFGRIAKTGGAFERIGPPIDPLQTDGFQLASGHAVVHTLPLEGARTPQIHVYDLATKTRRLVHEGGAQLVHPAINATQICWSAAVPFDKLVGFGAKAHTATFHTAQVFCSPVSGGAPVNVLPDTGLTYTFYLLDDERLMWVDSRTTATAPGSEKLVSVPVPKAK